MVARFLVLLSIIFIMISVGSQTTAQNLVTCPQVVQKAIDSVGNNCGGLDRNSACYGYQSVNAEFSQAQPANYFASPSDRARLAEIQRLGTSPLNEALNQWGIALLSVQANLPNTLPGQNVIFMLLGDSQVENAVQPDDVLQSGATLTLTTAVETPLQQNPDAGSAVLATIPAGTELTADARSADGGWVRVVFNALPGWVAVDALAAGQDTSTLASIGQDTGTPMQAFYFQSSISGTQCADAPNALVIQGPKNLTVSLRANGADMTIGSTIVLYQVAVDAQTQAFLTQQYGNIGRISRLLQIVVLDGHVVLNPGTPEEIQMNTGDTTYRCLSENASLGINGRSDDREVINTCPWAPPRPVTLQEVEPFRYVEDFSLNYPITLPLSLPPITTQLVEPTVEVTEAATDAPEQSPTPLPTAAPTEPAAQGAAQTILVGPLVNTPPVANDDDAVTDEDIPATVSVTANDTDSEGDALTVTGVTAGANGSTVNHGDGTITYTPDANFYGSDSFTYDISDGNGGSDTATVVVTVKPVNDPPIAVDDSASTPQGILVYIDVLLNDSDPEGDYFFLSLVSDPPNGTADIVSLSESGPIVISYVPDPGFSGVDTFTYTIDDGVGGTDTAIVTVTVGPNAGPTAVDDSAAGFQDVTLTVDAIANDTDPEGDVLSIFSTTDGASGTVTTDGYYLFYTPNPAFTGSDSFTYTVSDPSGNMDTATVSVRIAPNTGPTAVDDGSLRLPLPTSLDTPLWVYVVGNDIDPDGGSLLVVGTTSPSNGTLFTDGYSIEYTPNSGYIGTDSFTYTINDQSGAASTATVYVVVTGNHAPTAFDDTAITDEDVPVSVSVLTNDTDLDSGDTLSVIYASFGSFGSTTWDATTVTYTPNPDYNGPDTLSYLITDGNDAYYWANVYVTVNPVNDPPATADDAYAVQQDALLDVPAPGVLGNDYDPVEGDLLTAALVTDVSNGVLTLLADGSFLYTPDLGFVGADSFVYEADDGNGGKTPATVTLSVAINAAPTANDDAYTTPINTTLDFSLPGPLANDTDPNGDPLSAALVSTPTNGTLTLNGDGSFSYTPTSGFSGTDSFTYQASDGPTLSNVATAIITIGTPPVIPLGAVLVIGQLPYPSPTPLVPFADYAYIDDLVRSSVPQQFANTVFGRILVRGGILQPGLNWGYIGNQSLIDMGIVYAIDVFSTVGDTNFGVGIGVCLRGRGRLFFLDANFTPRSPRELDWTYVNGSTCATILAPGIIVLVRDDDSAAASTPTCFVTTLYEMNLRQGASIDTESLARVPSRTTLAAQPTGGWYAVTYNGIAGYLSGRYVSSSGGCTS